jgi:acyl-coenzyme A thioesterase PaaI-like protein
LITTTASEGAEATPSRRRLPLDAAQRAAWQARLNALPLLRHLGAALDLSDDAVVRVRLLERHPFHDGGLGTDALNGAVVAALMDCGMAASGILAFRGRTCGTLHLSIDYMKPVRIAEPVIECRVVRRTDSIVFVEARLAGRDGGACVRASGIVSVSQLAAGQPGDGGAGTWPRLLEVAPGPADAGTPASPCIRGGAPAEALDSIVPD